jgi:methionyl-tRNA formyltransferase
MNILILTDNIESWFVKYGKILQTKIEEKGHNVRYIFSAKDISESDICFILSCTKIIKDEHLQKNKHNIVIHASDLPKGKGFSPLQWQILEGKNEIILTLFEVVAKVDSGPYYIKDKIVLQGNELLPEIRGILAEKIIEMCLKFVDNIDEMLPVQQVGNESFYKRRTLEDDKIDINEPLIKQFNHFRICDNEKFPLWFEYLGKRYILKIWEM